jgi:hypothetical protein
MAEENNPGRLPPKIKLNGFGAVQAPKSPKSETARIDLTGARLPSADELKKRTAQINPPAPGMTPITDEDREEAMKKSTVRIEAVADMEAFVEEEREEVAKKATVKIDSADAFAAAPETGRDDTMKRATIRIESPIDLPPFGAQNVPDAAKRATIRITAEDAEIEPVSDKNRPAAAKKATVRVQIDEQRDKGDTARLDAAEVRGYEAAKKRTTRINLNEVLEEDQDIFKRRTALLDASTFAGTTEATGTPRTIRIKRLDTAPTGALHQPAEAEAVPVAPAPISSADLEASKKSETARIDLPPEIEDQPPTRRKTIRIKRPSGGSMAGKPLVIARAAGEPGAAPVRGGAEEEMEGSPLFAGVAMAAVFFTVLLIYVLAAQTFAPNLPFPGRL